MYVTTYVAHQRDHSGRRHSPPLYLSLVNLKFILNQFREIMADDKDTEGS